MKIKNLNIKKIIQNAAIAGVITGTFMLTTPVPTQAASYSNVETNNVMDYFTQTLQNNVDNYLNKQISSTNLNNLLGYYNTLYDYIYNNTLVRSTYYKNLDYYNQDELQYMLNTWGNDIYSLYKQTSYFKTNCINKLGFTLTYNSQEIGYDYDHKETMEYYTETQNDELNKYLYNSNYTQSNLRSALSVYKKLISFVKGNTRSYGYIFNELTMTEQEDIIRLLEDWTYTIMDKYSGYSYYSQTCISVIGWTLNMDNFNRELGEYTDFTIINPSYNQNNTVGNVYTHDTVISYFTINQESLINSYNATLNETNLSSALDVYNTLWKFIKGEVSVYGYYYTNLTTTEKQVLINLMNSWTTEIYNAYGNYENYATLSTSKIGWVVNSTNFNAQLTNLNSPVVSTPTSPVVTAPSTTVTTQPVNAYNQPINNTVGKNWHANYADPTYDTSREVRDYTPQYVDDYGYYGYDNYGYIDEYGYYYGNTNNYSNYSNYGYYDAYGNFIYYDQYNQYNNYDGYVADYVPTYTP